MESFDKWMKGHQTEWRRTHIESQEWGLWQKRPYPWILPTRLWEEGLWPGIRCGLENALPAYLKRTRAQKHRDAHHLNSSWMLCANLYFPFRTSSYSRGLFAAFLKNYVASEVDSLEAVELEYAESGVLHPSPLLGESGGNRGFGQTSPDLGLKVNGGRGLILVESKLAEDSFYDCSARRSRNRRRLPNNPDPDRCNHPLHVVNDYADQCHQHHPAWGRKYWEHLAPIVSKEALADLPHCPAARGGFQLFRQQALAEGIARSGTYNLVVSAVAVDARNDALDAGLRRRGIGGLKEWGGMFNGLARFAVFTHQEWVAWVKVHDTENRFGDWLVYVQCRYDMDGQWTAGTTLEP